MSSRNWVGLHLHLPTDERRRDGIPIRVDGHAAVAGHGPSQRGLQLERGPAIARSEPLLGETRRRLLVGGAVEALVGHLANPRVGLPRPVLEIRPLPAQDEAPLHVLDPGLDLAFGAGPIQPAEPRDHAVVAGEVPEHRVPLDMRAVGVAAQHDGLGIVVDDLFGEAAKLVEGVLVTADQRLEPLIGSELDVQAPRVPEHHHEGLGAAPPLGEGEPGGGPVDLGLTARSRLEPHRGLCQDPLGLAQRRTARFTVS